MNERWVDSTLVGGSTLVDMLSGLMLVDMLCGSMLCGSGFVDMLCGSTLVDMHCGSTLVDMHCGSTLVDMLCGSMLVDMLCGSTLVDMLCGSTLVDMLCGSTLVDMLCGCTHPGLHHVGLLNLLSEDSAPSLHAPSWWSWKEIILFDRKVHMWCQNRSCELGQNWWQNAKYVIWTTKTYLQYVRDSALHWIWC